MDRLNHVAFSGHNLTPACVGFSFTFPLYGAFNRHSYAVIEIKLLNSFTTVVVSYG